MEKEIRQAEVSKIAQFFYKMLGIVSAVFFGGILLIKLLAPVFYLPKSAIFVSFFACLLLAVFVFVFKENVLQFVERGKRALENASAGKLLAAVFLISFVPKLVCGLITQIDSRYVNVDIWIYQNVASEFLRDGYVTTYADYCNGFPHIFWFAMILAPWIKLFHGSQIALFIVFDLFLSFSSVLLFDAFRERTSKTRAFLALTIYNLLPSTILLPQFITHEIPFLLLLSISLWLYFKVFLADRSKMAKTACFFLFAAAISLATVLNACGYIACIALTIHFLFFDNNSKPVKRVLKAFVLLFTAISLMTSSGFVLEPNLDQEKISSAEFSSIGWTLYAGANTQSKGGYSSEDAKKYGWKTSDLNTYDEQGMPDSQVEDLRRQLITARYQGLVKKPAAALKLYAIKVGKIWSYFNYPYTSIPGIISQPDFQQIYVSYFEPTLTAIDVFMGLIALLMAVSGFLNSGFLNRGIYQFAVLFLIGCTFMFTIAECNNKYTISMQPFIWLVIVLNARFSILRKRPRPAIKKKPGSV